MPLPIAGVAGRVGAAVTRVGARAGTVATRVGGRAAARGAHRLARKDEKASDERRRARRRGPLGRRRRRGGLDRALGVDFVPRPRGPVGRRRRRSRLARALVAAVVLLVLLPMVLSVFLVMGATNVQRDQALAATQVAGMGRVAAQAMTGAAGACPLPPAQLAAQAAEGDGIADPATVMPAFEAYCSAAGAYQLDWALLAGIGRMECLHGTSELPGCDPDLRNADGTRRTNGTGARGPMQFLGSTWRRSATAQEPEVAGPPIPEGQEPQGYATDGDGDGTADPWAFLDAAHAAARYLVALGGRTAPAEAAFDYHSGGGVPFRPDHFYPEGVVRHADAYRKLAPGAAPTGAVPEGTEQTRVEGITVNVAIANDVARLVQAARAAELPALTGDGYRSHERQIALRRAHCGPSQYAIYSMPSSQCSPPTARPGASMHERGLAIDFRCGGHLIESHSDPCFRWLAANAATYGLRNLPSEPWHWSVNGN